MTGHFPALYQLNAACAFVVSDVHDIENNFTFKSFAYPSYVVTLAAVIPEFKAFNCACVNGVSFTVYWYSQPLL